jgi:hypothetical protein
MSRGLRTLPSYDHTGWITAKDVIFTSYYKVESSCLNIDDLERKWTARYQGASRYQYSPSPMRILRPWLCLFSSNKKAPSKSAARPGMYGMEIRL